MSLRPRTLAAGFIAPCLPTNAHTLPSGGLWLHEIKHDGFRIIARKNGARVRLYSRPGNDHADKDGKHRIVIEGYGYRWFRVGGLDYLLRRSDIDQPAKQSGA